MPINPALIPAIIGGASSILGGIMGRSGQRDANAANLQIARENRQWQERMSNTAYQRAAHDMEQAGLNRILAIGSPATTPQGNVAKMENVGKATMEGAAMGANAFATAYQTRKVAAEARALDAQVPKTRAETAKINKETAALGLQMGLTRRQIEQVGANINLIKANEQLAKNQAEKILAETRIQLTAAQKAEFELGLQKALYDGNVGQVLYYIKELAVPLAALGLGVGMGRGKKPADKPKPQYDKYRTGPNKGWWKIPETN